MAARLQERLRAARQRRFVGREAETALFQSMLRAEEPPFCLLHFYGPGGIGKTTLVRTLAAACEAEEAQALLLDGRHLEPNPAAFLIALRRTMELVDDASLTDALEVTARRPVLLIDTYEFLTPLDGWFRDTFLPDLPARVLVVTAGRAPMALDWHADPGWQALLREVPLRTFSHDESRTYLTRRQVDTEQHQAILAFTHGHPLALSLVADLFEQQPGLIFQPDAAPDVIKVLVDQFLQQVPGPAHRAALEASALVRVINETLLAEMLAVPEAHELFAWLRRVSFMDAGPYGLFPHELARDALATDLRWRNPDWFAELHDRARRYYAHRLELAGARDQQRVLFDYVYLHRDNPIIKPFLDWQETGSSLPEPPTPADHAALLAMVVQHEGNEAARWAAYWLDRQPENALVFRGNHREPIGFLQRVSLHQLSEDERTADPAIAAAYRYLRTNAPLRPGEAATHFRFWMAADTYQNVSAVQSLLFLKIAQHYLTTPGLAFSFFPCADPDFWAPFCLYTELHLLPEADYEIEGRRYGIFAHDWRAVPPLLWLDHLAARELETEPQPAPAAHTESRLAVLDAAAFQAAVRDALRAYASPFDLRDNPLLRCRLVVNHAGPDADEARRIDTLRRLINEAADRLRASPRDAPFYHALDRAYLHPARSQEQAAERLGLPLSTFRRHLKRGVQHLTQYLWRLETAGLSA